MYSELKNYPKYFSKEILQDYQEKFPNYLQCSEQTLWDINEMDYYEYVIKHRCQDTIKNLNNQKNELSKKNSIIINENENLKNQNINFTKKNKKLKEKNKRLKKKLSKQNKINNEILNSRSWKLTSFFRKFKNFFK